MSNLCDSRTGAVSVTAETIREKLVSERGVESRPCVHKKASVLLDNHGGVGVGERSLPRVGPICLGHTKCDKVCLTVHDQECR